MLQFCGSVLFELIVSVGAPALVTADAVWCVQAALCECLNGKAAVEVAQVVGMVCRCPALLWQRFQLHALWCCGSGMQQLLAGSLHCLRERCRAACLVGGASPAALLCNWG